MLKRYQSTIGDLLRVFDALLVVSAWLFAYWQRFTIAPIFEVTKGFPEFGTYAALSPLVAVLWIAVFTWLRVYEPRRMVDPFAELAIVLKAHGVALLFFISITYLFEDYKYSRLVMVYFGVTAALVLAVFRLTVRSMVRRLRAHGFSTRQVLAVGEGETIERLVDRIELFPELGLRVVGIVTSETSVIASVSGKPVVGHFGDLPEIIANNRADEVLIALGPGDHQELDRILELLKDETLDVRMVPDVYRHVTLGCEVEIFDGLPIMRLNDSPLIGWSALLKRATDVVFSLLALFFLAPAMLIIAALVKLTSRGPVLYRQERMGLDGRTFDMLKFRSMRVDAEKLSGAVWAQAGDDRRTPIGAFLRRTSLDELPQFWNVLVGDMSLVGPRPERPVFVRKFRHEIPHYMLRHKVKSGITGWAQVKGWRGNTSLVHRIECDIFYIKNWSLLLDLRILLMTVWKGFIHKNAY